MKYYALMDQSLHGPFEAEALTTLPNFTRRTLVQVQERFDSDYSRWTEAGEVPLLAVLMDTRDRGATHARSAAALDAFSAARRANERDAAALRREVVEGVLAQRAALEGAREELARFVVRIADVEAALKDIKRALYWGVAVVGALGLALLARPLLHPRPEPGAKAVPEARPPAPVPPALEPERQAARPRPIPSPAPPPASDQEAEAASLVEGSPLPPGAAVRCPRSPEEESKGGAGPARTPRELASCRAVARLAALRSALVAERRWPQQKAGDLLAGVLRDKGGFDAVFPPYTAVRRRAGRTYDVEVGRRDLLTPALSVLLNSDLPVAAVAPQRYAADLKTRSVEPLGRQSPAPASPAAAGVEEEAKAVASVRDFLFPSPEASRCPRTLEEALEDGGGPARTPLELADCRAVLRFMALRSALAAGRRWSARKALRFLTGVVEERGGFEAVFPPYHSARLLEGRTYEVELGRRDLLTPGLSVLLDLDLPADAAPPQRYEADLDAGAVRPLPSP